MRLVTWFGLLLIVFAFPEPIFSTLALSFLLRAFFPFSLLVTVFFFPLPIFPALEILFTLTYCSKLAFISCYPFELVFGALLFSRKGDVLGVRVLSFAMSDFLPFADLTLMPFLFQHFFSSLLVFVLSCLFGSISSPFYTLCPFRADFSPEPPGAELRGVNISGEILSGTPFFGGTPFCFLIQRHSLVLSS